MVRMAQWAVIIPADRWATERHFHHDTVTVPGGAGPVGPDDEVREAVAYFVGVSPLRYATADGVAEQAGTNLLLGLGVDYVDQSLAALADVTAASATRAFQEVVRLDELSLVVVGDAEVVAEPLREVGFADLEVRTR